MQYNKESEPKQQTNSEELALVSSSQFVENVKRWVLLDTYLKKIQEKTKELRNEKNELVETICQYLETHGLASKKINIPDGDIRCFEKKEYASLSFGYLEECLGKLMEDKSQIDFVIDYLKQNRKITTSMELRRTYRDKA